MYILETFSNLFSDKCKKENNYYDYITYVEKLNRDMEDTKKKIHSKLLEMKITMS